MIKDDREWKAAREQEIEEMKKEMEDKKLQVIRDKEESERQQMEMEEETMKEFIELEWEQSKKEGSSKAKAFTAITFLLTNDNDILQIGSDYKEEQNLDASTLYLKQSPKKNSGKAKEIDADYMALLHNKLVKLDS